MRQQAAFALAIAAGLGCGTAAAADPVEDFYRNKTITVTIPAETGGGYDLYARLMTRFLGKYIPGNPSFVMKYVPGSGGIKAANHIYNLAPKDGSEISIPLASIVVAQLIQPDRVRFDAAKFGWIGTVAELIANTDAVVVAQCIVIPQTCTPDAQQITGPVLADVAFDLYGTDSTPPPPSTDPCGTWVEPGAIRDRRAACCCGATGVLSAPDAIFANSVSGRKASPTSRGSASRRCDLRRRTMRSSCPRDRPTPPSWPRA